MPVPCRSGPWLCRLKCGPAAVVAQLFFVHFNVFYVGHGVYNGRESTKNAGFQTEYEKCTKFYAFSFVGADRTPSTGVLMAKVTTPYVVLYYGGTSDCAARMSRVGERCTILKENPTEEQRWALPFRARAQREKCRNASKWRQKAVRRSLLDSS